MKSWKNWTIDCLPFLVIFHLTVSAASRCKDKRDVKQKCNGNLSRWGYRCQKYKPDAGTPKRPDLQMRFVPAVPATADGINAYVKFSQIKKAGDYWPSGWALQLLNIQPR